MIMPETMKMPEPINQLTIRGFKSIGSMEKFKLSTVNIFIGGNGAGKSNLIEFFRLLQSSIKGKLQDYIRSGGGISDFLFNGRKNTSYMDFEIWAGAYGYRFAIKPGPFENALLADEACCDTKASGQWHELGDSPDGEALLAKEAKRKTPDCPCAKPVYDAINSCCVYHFHDTSATAAMRHYEIIQDNKILRPDGANIGPYLLRLKSEHPEIYQEILDAVRLVMPFLDDFQPEPTAFGEKQKANLSWRQKGSDYPMQPYHLSDGSIRFICLATALLGPNPPSTVIIDEPELGQHPSAISVLAELIQDASRRTQLVVATQSPDLIDYFGVADLIVVNRKAGASTFERLQQTDFNVWLEAYSLGELWSKNVIAGGPVYE